MLATNGTIGYVAPAEKLANRDPVIFADRDRKVEPARERRQADRAASRAPRVNPTVGSSPDSSLGATTRDGLVGG
jgi:hypothetical protein